VTSDSGAKGTERYRETSARGREGQPEVGAEPREPAERCTAGTRAKRPAGQRAPSGVRRAAGRWRTVAQDNEEERDLGEQAGEQRGVANRPRLDKEAKLAR